MGLVNKIKKTVRKARIMKKVRYLKKPEVLRAGANLKYVSRVHSLNARRYEERLKYFEKMAQTATTPQEKAEAKRQIKIMQEMINGNKEWARAARFIHTKNAKK